jgi:hypothetical protein
MASQGRRRKNKFHNAIWHILLHENAGGVVQRQPNIFRLMKAVLKDQVGKNVFSYVNDISVASKKKALYITDLIETFTNMREAKLKLNPEKCVFGVT